MRAMNLYLLTRVDDRDVFSSLARELTGNTIGKEYSEHEMHSLRALVTALIPALREDAAKDKNWVRFLDGFYFSYTIAHISKEFDLIKISEDGSCVLNIELKSEEIGTERILKQLAQNRYYLSHISNTIYSYTYVMETNTLYSLHEKGFLRICEIGDLAEVLKKPAFSGYVEQDLDQYFRAADYLISPVSMPEKYLQGNYFLTNQQSEFSRRILQCFEEEGNGGRAPAVSVTGSAGTGKTLLLFDLAMVLSRKKRVLIIHGGRLQKGHKVIDNRLRNVFIRTADQPWEKEGCDYLMVDEANRIGSSDLDRIFSYVRQNGIPCVMAYDLHTLTDESGVIAAGNDKIGRCSDLHLEFTGNIRINRPVYAFLRELFHPKEQVKSVDYGCIDVIYADDRNSAGEILAYYTGMGYQKITLPGGGGAIGEGLTEDEIVGLEFERVLIIMDDRFYYDEDNHLRAMGDASEKAVSVLYEGISRAREKLCLLVLEDEHLFSRILAVREQ